MHVFIRSLMFVFICKLAVNYIIYVVIYSCLLLFYVTLFVCHFVTPCVSHNNGVKSHTPHYNGTGRSSHYELLKCDSGTEKKFKGYLN